MEDIQMSSDRISDHREFLKDSLRLKINFSLSDQHQDIPPPPLQKPARAEQKIIPLPGEDSWDKFLGTDLVHAISQRKSERSFLPEPVSVEELAYLLWATQGVKKKVAPETALRTVPSAGCRHPFETYLLINKIEGLDCGIYRYLPLEHTLVLEQLEDNLAAKLIPATLGQQFIASAPVVFVWAAVPYRSEWRYLESAHRVMLLDAGHICQNLYLACQALECGTCAIAAYSQIEMDTLLGLDGKDEFTVYLAPVGKVAKR